MPRQTTDNSVPEWVWQNTPTAGGMAKLTFDEAAAYLKGRDGELNAQLAHMGGAPLDALQRQFAAEESELSTLRRARDNDAQRARDDALRALKATTAACSSAHAAEHAAVDELHREMARLKVRRLLARHD